MTQLLDSYRAHILLERGLSENTRDAYTRDVDKLLSFLADEGVRPEAATLDHLHRFAFALADIGISPTSVARILSGVR